MSTYSETAPIAIVQGRTSEATPATLTGGQLLAGRAATETASRVVEVGTGAGGSFRSQPWEVDVASAEPTITALAVAADTHAPRALFGGHCAMAFGTAPIYLDREPRAKLLWIDAHGDFNTPETTRSGFLGGMILSGLVGRWRPEAAWARAPIDEDRVVLAGTSDLDPDEERLLRSSGVELIQAAELDADRLMTALDGAPVFVHLDLDVIDATVLPAEYPSTRGLQPTAVRDLLGALVGAVRVIGFEVGGFRSPTVGWSASADVAWEATAPLVTALRIGSQRPT